MIGYNVCALNHLKKEIILKNMKITIFILACTFAAMTHGKTIHKGQFKRSSGETWGYLSAHGVLGPNEWKNGHGYEACGANSQSPIDIKCTGISDAALELTNADDITGTLSNNGHSPTLALDDNVKVTVRVNDGNEYRLKQFHFHFGCDDSKGSEHEVNGEAYSGELHFVFYDPIHGSFNDAVNKPHGLTVVGVFLQVVEDAEENDELNKVVAKLSDIRKQGSSVAVTDEIEIDDLAEQFEDPEYYSYSGSLTTPPCYESVNWIVMKKPLNVTKRQIDLFRKLESEHGENGLMCNNFRPIQATNGREVILGKEN